MCVWVGVVLFFTVCTVQIRCVSSCKWVFLPPGCFSQTGLRNSSIGQLHSKVNGGGKSIHLGLYFVICRHSDQIQGVRPYRTNIFQMADILFLRFNVTWTLDFNKNVPIRNSPS